MQILHAVDRLDQTRNELFELREQFMALHGMAAHMLRDNTIPGPETDVEDIHELVEIVDSGGFDLIEAGETIQSCCEPLRALDSEECLAAREGWVDQCQSPRLPPAILVVSNIPASAPDEHCVWVWSIPYRSVRR